MDPCDYSKCDDDDDADDGAGEINFNWVEWNGILFVCEPIRSIE